MPPSADPTPVVAIVGGGAAGTLTASRLLRGAQARRCGLRVVLFDPGAPGRGVAYATQDAAHRLNVRAQDMSAAPEDPAAFVRWRDERLDAAEDPFASRPEFGAYLEDTLEQACDGAHGVASLEVRTDRVTAVTEEPDGALCVWPSGDAPVRAERVVLALGNRPPGPVPGLERGERHPRVVADPWAPGALDALSGAQGRILLVGTGLTMVDVALTLAQKAPEATLRGVSRTGLLPRAHRRVPRPRGAPVVSPRAGLRLEQIATAVQAAVDDDPEAWREVVDGLRPVTQGLWQALPEADQREFLARNARRWNVHRHRMAPSVATRLAGLRDAGTLEIRAARVLKIAGAPGGPVDVDLLPMPVPTEPHERVQATWMVNCTGPDTDLDRTGDPLVAQLLTDGLAERHPLGLGLSTDAAGRLLGPRAQGRLTTLGCLRQGELYESTAIPEIRVQAAGLATRLLEEV